MSQTDQDTAFDELTAALQQGGVGQMLEKLAEQYKAEKRFGELFEVRVMQGRQRLGLPLKGNDASEELTIDKQIQLDHALLESCKEIGGYLLKDGAIVDAWKYLRHANLKRPMAEALAECEPDEENLEGLLEVAVHERVAPARGFEWILQHMGSCNAVTMFEQVSSMFSVEERGQVASRIVKHLYHELSESLSAQIQREEGSPPPEKTVSEMIADRDWLFLGDSYHIDTSHLSMGVRYSVWIQNPEDLKLSLQLCDYGQRLSSQFHYEGEEPFKDSFADHAKFFHAQLGEQVEENLAYFREKATTLPVNQHGTVPAEAYVALLTRLRRYDEAMKAAVELIPPHGYFIGLAPNLLELAKLANNYPQALEVCRSQADRLNFVLALSQQTAS